MRDLKTKLQIKLMYQEAEDRLCDAEILSSNPDSRGSSYLLNLLAFELLLKCLLLISNQKSEKGHDYDRFFSCLPEEMQQRVLSTAKDRMTIHTDYSYISCLLKTFGKNFIELRYPYEKYKNLSEGEYIELGEKWIAEGAKDEQATFVLHPEELYGLNYAVASEVKKYLFNK